MAKRYIGDAVIDITYYDGSYGKQDGYRGTIRAGGYSWKFDDLHAPQIPTAGSGFTKGYDSSEAYDEMAASAVSFGSYYTTHNRGKDTPDWAPPAEVADAIDEATSWAMDDQGRHEVKRSPTGKGRMRDNPTWSKVFG